MHPKRRNARILVEAWLLIATLSTSSAAVLPSNAVVAGKTIGEWTAEWNKWAYAAPTNRHPFLDTNGSSAPYGQEGPVFFAPGGPANVSGPPLTLSFSVPDNKYLLIPILNSEWDNIDVDPPFTVEQLRDNNEAVVRGVTELRATFDGVPVPFSYDPVSGFFGHRAISPVFSFNFTNADNINTLLYGHPVIGLVDPIVTDGYWLMLEPLPPGTHELQTGVTLGFPSYTRSLIYKITAVPDPNMPTNAVVAGKTIGEWSAEWWKWVYSLSTNQHPLFDTTGAWANSGQPDAPVFFLAGIFNESGTARRSFVVPEGKYLFLPLVNVGPDCINESPPCTVEHLRDVAKSSIDLVTGLHASIDGVPGTDLFSYRAASPVFNFEYKTADNISSLFLERPITGLNDPIVSDGYWLMLKPLPLGKHVINFGAEVDAPVHFQLDITDTITVVPDPNQYVMSSNAFVSGKTIGEWTAECWKWIYSIPTNQNPQLDCDGQWANNQQPYRDVFFVAPLNGVTPTPCVRTFSMPENRYLLLPLLPLTIDNIDIVPPFTIPEMYDIIDAAVRDPRELHATIDGVGVTNLLSHRATSPPFSFEGTNCDNVTSRFYGRCITNVDPIIADGYWLMLEHLPLGQHTIRVGGTDELGYFLPHDIILNITVVPDATQFVLAPDATVCGKTQAEMSAEWWKYNFSLSTNIAVPSETLGRVYVPAGPWDNTCPVYYLGSRGFAGLTRDPIFNIPEDAYIFFPIQSVFCDNTGVDPPQTPEQLRDCAGALMEFMTEAHVSIDGAVVSGFRDHRQIAPFFAVEFTNPDNLYSMIFGQPFTGLVDPIAVDGYYVLLHGLSPGMHKLMVGATFGPPVNASWDLPAYINIVPDANLYPMPTNAVVGGKTIGEWTAEWWKWVFSISTNQNPHLDETGLFAHIAQTNDDVFFLGGHSGLLPDRITRSFTVPENKYLLFPILVAQNDNIGVDPPLPTPEVIDLIVQFLNNPRDLHASIDGLAITNLLAHRALSPVFRFDFTNPDNFKSLGNPFPVLGPVDPIVGDGYWLMLRPLPPGEHVLRYGGAFRLPYFYTNDVIARITVVPEPLTHVTRTNAIVGGKTIEDWTAEWWKWIYSLPTNQNPLLECDGSRVQNGQDGPVFFASGGPFIACEEPITLSYTVPENKYLLVPIARAAWDNVDTDPPLTVEELRDNLATHVRSVTDLHAILDGVSVPFERDPASGFFNHRAISPVFSFAFDRPDSMYSVFYNRPFLGVVDPIVADGYWIMLEPLSRGVHELRTGTTFGFPGLTASLIHRITVGEASTNDVPPNPTPTNLLAVTCPPTAPLQPSSIAREDFWVPDGQVNAMVETNGVLYIGGLFDYVSPNSLTGGAFDPLSGVPVPNFPKVNGAIKAIDADRAGGWFVGGIFNSVGGYPLNNLAHIRADGMVDTSWAPNPDGAVLTIVTTPDKVYVGGTFTTIGGQAHSLVAALNAATGAVLPFKADATTRFPKPSVNALVLSGNTLYMAGYFSFINGAEREHLGAVDAETGAVMPWHPNGYTGSQAGSRIDALAISENLLFVGGTFTSIGGTQTNGPARNFIAALDVTGPDFGSVIEWDPNADGPVTCLAVTCDTVYVGGAFTHIGGQARNRIAALDTTTGRATDWNPNANGDILSLRLAGNTIYTGGKFTEIGGQSREFLAALDAKTGQAKLWTPKADFGVSGINVSGGAVYAGGVVAGGGKLRKNVAALDVRTGRPLDWAPTVSGETIINAFPFRGVYSLAATADTLYLGGPFTRVNGQPRNHVAAVSLSTGQPTAWQPDVNGIVEAIALSDGTVFLGGRFTQVGGLPRQNIAAVDAVSGVPLVWNPGANDKVKSLLTCDNALFAGGLFTTIAGAPHSRLAALEIDSGLSFNWSPTANDQVAAMALSAGEIFFGGQFSVVGGQARLRIATADFVSGRPTCWNPSVRMIISTEERSAAVNAMIAAGDTVFAGGSFNRIAGQSRNNLAALSTNCPGIPTAWDPNVDGTVLALASRGNTLFAGGSFQNVGTQFRPNLAVFPPEGAPHIAEQPRSAQLMIGANITLSGAAAGDGSLSFQWQFNGTDLPGATSPALTIANTQVADSGEYTLIVTNDLGLVSSRPATLVVLDPIRIVSQPRNQTRPPGHDITLRVEATGNPAPTYQWRLNGVNIPGAIYPTLVISNAQPSDGGSYTVIAANLAGAVRSDVATVVVKSAPLPFQDDFGSLPVKSENSKPHKGVITGATGVGSGSNERATNETGEPNHAGKRGGKSVWLRWIAPAGGIATFSTRGSSFDTLLAVYAGTDFSDFSEVVADEDRGGFATSEVSFNAIAGTEYFIAVDGLAGAAGDIVLGWSLDTSTVPFPRITGEPRSQTVPANVEVRFAIEAVSTTPLRYQWFLGCRPLAGETNAVLIVSTVNAQNVGGYRCLVMNASTHVAESADALLEIGPDRFVQSQDKLEDVIANATSPPPIAVRLASLSLAASSLITVSAGAPDSQIFNNARSTTSATEPNHCGVLGGASKWFGLNVDKNGVLLLDTIGSAIDTVLAVYTGGDPASLVPIACDNNGAPDQIRSLLKFPASAATQYWVVVDGVNAAEGTVKLNWQLGLKPSFFVNPHPATVHFAQTFVLCVTATNTFPEPTYQWFRNGRAIAGATNACLTTLQTNAGTYSIVAQNFAGATTNSVGLIDVAMPITVTNRLVTTGGIRYSRITGPPAKKYIIEAENDLLPPWLPLYTNNSTNATAIQFTDPRPVTNAGRFYRVIPAP